MANEIKPEQVPDKVVDALWEVPVGRPVGVLAFRYEAKLYLAAALNAWPGMLTERRARCDAVVLPYNLDADLPQEASDGK